MNDAFDREMAPNLTGPEVGFIDFNLAREGAVEGAFIGHPSSHFL
jgi:hypothetical protein